VYVFGKDMAKNGCSNTVGPVWGVGGALNLNFFNDIREGGKFEK
jgi:hypothetical protein